MPNLSELKSQLRPYQETGVFWLFFLYLHGLSGLLCDDMGLGKTHQAMALMASVKQESPKAKFLVVCPTSVLYHWEDKLREGLARTPIASVGPAVSDELKSHGLRTDIYPAEESFFMRPLISAMARMRRGARNMAIATKTRR